jgi:hypothetical protein
MTPPTAAKATATVIIQHKTSRMFPATDLPSYSSSSCSSRPERRRFYPVKALGSRSPPDDPPQRHGTISATVHFRCISRATSCGTSTAKRCRQSSGGQRRSRCRTALAPGRHLSPRQTRRRPVPRQDRSWLTRRDRPTHQCVHIARSVRCRVYHPS